MDSSGQFAQKGRGLAALGSVRTLLDSVIYQKDRTTGPVEQLKTLSEVRAHFRNCAVGKLLPLTLLRRVRPSEVEVDLTGTATPSVRGWSRKR